MIDIQNMIGIFQINSFYYPMSDQGDFYFAHLLLCCITYLYGWAQIPLLYVNVGYQLTSDHLISLENCPSTILELNKEIHTETSTHTNKTTLTGSQIYETLWDITGSLTDDTYLSMKSHHSGFSPLVNFTEF